MRRFVLFASLLAGVSLPATSAAAFYNGNDLYRACRGNDYLNGVCLGYVMGAMDAWTTGRILDGKTQCVRIGVRAGQVRDVVLKYLEDNPGERDHDADRIVAKALHDAFCPNE